MLWVLSVGSPGVLTVLYVKHDLRKNKIVVASTTGFFKHLYQICKALAPNLG
jgi:hypothetical protein